MLVLLALISLLPVLGCQSGGSGLTNADAAKDDVHRIVESGRLRVGMSGVQPPLNMRNKAGELVGLDVELARALADAMDLELVLVERPFGTLLSGLANDDFDLVISSMTITPARNARVAFAGPYLISGASLLTREEIVDNLGGVEDLDSPDRTWGALEGSTGAELIQEAFPQATLVTTDDLASLIPRVIDGEVDGLVSDLPFVQFVRARHPDAGLAILRPPFTTEPLGIALSPDSPLLANLVQNYLNTLRRTGELMQMKARWLNAGDWLSELP